MDFVVFFGTPNQLFNRMTVGARSIRVFAKVVQYCRVDTASEDRKMTSTVRKGQVKNLQTVRKV